MNSQIKNTMLSNKLDIENWLNQMNISDYTINNNLVVDVANSVNLRAKGLTCIPIQFGIVIGDFDCSDNQLTSLFGAPKIVEVDFNCSYNQLTNLEGSPEVVKGLYECGNNKLISLKGATQEVGGFFCMKNQLTSLVGGPQKVLNYYLCTYNQLTNLEGAPTFTQIFDCSNNPIQITKIININLHLFRHSSTNESVIELFKEYYKLQANEQILALPKQYFDKKMDELKIREEKESLDNILNLPSKNKKIKL